MTARGVIHDIGYRPYDGPRGSRGAIARSLYLTGLRHCFGLGRSGRSKIMPFILLALMILPAVIVIGVVTIVGLDALPMSYAGYAVSTSVLPCVFAAAQGPVLFSRDLRHGTIALYFARPLSATAYTLARWGALATAVFCFLATPVLILYAGALLAGFDLGEETRQVATALVLTALLAGMLASVSAAFSAIALRRGFAVVGTIATLLFGYGVVAAIQGVALDSGRPRVGQIAGLFHPLTLYAGDVVALTDGDPTVTPPVGAGMEALYLLVSVLVVLAGLALVLARFRRVVGR